MRELRIGWSQSADVFSDINQRSFDREMDLVAWAGFNYESYEQGTVDLTRYHNKYFSVDRFRRLNRVLDVSCGPGVTLNWFASQKNWTVFGVDPDRHAIGTSQSCLRKNLNCGKSLGARIWSGPAWTSTRSRKT